MTGFPWGEVIEAIDAVLIGAILAIPLVLYCSGAFRRQRRYELRNLPSPSSEHFDFTLASLSDSCSTQGKAVGFWVGADDIYAARHKAIAAAQHSIQFETFFMTPGRRAEEFAQAIIQKAKAGVKVQLLADGYGTKSLSPSYWKRLRSAGVEVGLFNPFNWRSPLDYVARTHRKLLLVDQKVALIGGAGVSDLWDGTPDTGGHHAWLDFEVALQGEVVSLLRGIFLQHWLDTCSSVDFQGRNLTPSAEQEPKMLVTPGEDPTYRDSSIRSLLHVLITAAKHRIWIASPYFLPDLNTRLEMIAAKQRGVDIRVLTMGPLSDKPFVYEASRTMYPELLSADVAIYEYQPSMMHSKLVLIDDAWVSFGSANFDPRSFFHNDELNLSTPEPRLLQQVEDFFEKAFSDSRHITIADLRNRSLRARLLGQASLLLYWQL